MKKSEFITGYKQVLKAIYAENVRQVYVADDADEPIRAQVLEACRLYHIPVEAVATMKELGQMCKIAVGAAAGASKK